MKDEPKNDETAKANCPGAQRAQWQRPQMRKLDAREAEIKDGLIVHGLGIS